MSRKIEEQIEQLVSAKIAEMGYELVDVEYAKVKGQDDELDVYKRQHQQRDAAPIDDIAKFADIAIIHK